MTQKEEWSEIKTDYTKLLKKRELDKKWRTKNRERLNREKREDYHKNMGKYVEYRKAYLKNHKNDPVFRFKQRSYSNKKSFELKMALLTLIGTKCGKCNFDDIRALQFDHIKGGGSVDRKLHAGHNFYRYYLSHPEIAIRKLQVLCANCNHIKRYENEEFRQPKYLASISGWHP